MFRGNNSEHDQMVFAFDLFLLFLFISISFVRSLTVSIEQWNEKFLHDSDRESYKLFWPRQVKCYFVLQ